jgi:hypothetical protein
MSCAVAMPFFPQHRDNMIEALGGAECGRIKQRIGQRDVEHLLQAAS